MKDKPENWSKGLTTRGRLVAVDTETPFTSNNKWWLYMWNSIEKDHYYYCFDDDLFHKELEY